MKIFKYIFFFWIETFMKDLLKNKLIFRIMNNKYFINTQISNKNIISTTTKFIQPSI